MSLIPPKELPDLEHLTPHTPRMALRRIFQHGGARKHRGYVLQLNAVRLADMAVAEYTLGRSAVREYHSKRKGIGIGLIMKASGHFESCIWAVQRFVKHAKALRSSKFLPQELKALIPRGSTFLRVAVERRVTNMRDCLAHLETDALNGSLPQGSNIILLPVTSGLCIGNHKITWAELNAWIKEMHSCAGALADYASDSSNAPTNGA